MNTKDNKYYAEEIKKDYKVFLQFLKAKFPTFHNSNFFFRDLQFGIIKYFESKGEKIPFSASEPMANLVGNFLEEEKIFIRVNQNGWKLNYPEFVTTTAGDPF